MGKIHEGKIPRLWSRNQNFAEKMIFDCFNCGVGVRIWNEKMALAPCRFGKKKAPFAVVPEPYFWSEISLVLLDVKSFYSLFHTTHHTVAVCDQFVYFLAEHNVHFQYWYRINKVLIFGIDNVLQILILQFIQNTSWGQFLKKFKENLKKNVTYWFI